MEDISDTPQGMYIVYRLVGMSETPLDGHMTPARWFGACFNGYIVKRETNKSGLSLCFLKFLT